MLGSFVYLLKEVIGLVLIFGIIKIENYFK